MGTDEHDSEGFGLILTVVSDLGSDKKPPLFFSLDLYSSSGRQRGTHYEPCLPDKEAVGIKVTSIGI